MRSSTRRPPGEAPSSLEDSSYELLGESMLDASEDEDGHTASLASTDHTPDDVSSLSDDDEFEDNPNESTYPLEHHESQPYADHAPSADASMLTSTADTQSSEESYIYLEEERAVDGSLNASGTVTMFDESRGLPRVLQGYGCSEIKHTVRMRLSERHLPVPRSYRLLYVGEFPEWGVKEVNAQIAAALDATPSSSRFNIVQGPAYPGGPSSSNVQLERAGPELVVDHCKTPRIIQDANHAPRVLITLDDETQLIFGPAGSVCVNGESSGVRLPDLVIFCHYTMQSESDSESEVQKFWLAREAFERNNIPILDIATTRPYGRCPLGFSYNTSSLQLCVEGRNNPNDLYEVQEVLPIDIYAFSSVDPSQLNRHLSFISPRTSRSELKPVKKDNAQWSFGKLVPGLASNSSLAQSRELWAQPRSWIILLGLSTMLTMYIFQPTPWIPLRPTYEVLQSSTNNPESFIPTSPVTTDTPVPVGTPKSQLVPGVSRDLTIVPTQETPRKEQREPSGLNKKEVLGGFEIEVVDHRQFALRVAKDSSTNKKRKPTVKIEVFRNSEPVPFKVSQTLDGNYNVELTQDYLSSTFSVHVVAKLKSLHLDQSFDVRLGTPRSKLQDLIEVVKCDVVMAQYNLRNMTTSVSQRIHSSVVFFEEGAAAALHQTRNWKKQLKESTLSVTDHLQEASREAVRQVNIGSKVTMDVSKTLWNNYQELASRCESYTRGAVQNIQRFRPDLWQRSASIRQSRPMRRARKNALAIRKKMFGKLGQISTQPTEEKVCKHGKCEKKRGRWMR